MTLHDPCNEVRLMGIIEPQREIMRAICPQFREMEPHGANNYCCGGGSGFAIMSGHNFPDWRFHVTGRKKLEQILNAFSDCMDLVDSCKYLCAPCSNCKGQFRDMISYYGLWEKNKILYGGLVGIDCQCHDDRQARLHRLGAALKLPVVETSAGKGFHANLSFDRFFRPDGGRGGSPVPRRGKRGASSPHNGPGHGSRLAGTVGDCFCSFTTTSTSVRCAARLPAACRAR